jgi:nucleoside-diphosphate-sugar epimerase
MNVFITGINGFIASRLSRSLQDQGHSVSGSTSQAGEPTGPPIRSGRVFQHRLGSPVDAAMFTGMATVVHCAYDFQKGALAKNVEGTIALAKAARQQQVGRQIFISSLSSRADAQSDYGRAKFAVEGLIHNMEGIIVRPGTVLGEGGIFGKMVRLVRTYPVVPLLDGGTSQMYVIGLDDLCLCLKRIIETADPSQEYNLYYPEKVTLKEILMIVRRLAGRPTLLIPIPAALLVLPLSLLNRLGLKLPIDIENLRGFIKSQTMIYSSDLPKLLPTDRPLEEILRTQLT